MGKEEVIVTKNVFNYNNDTRKMCSFLVRLVDKHAGMYKRASACICIDGSISCNLLSDKRE